GNVYKIQIGGFAGASGTYTLGISANPSTCQCTGAPPEGEAGCGIPIDTFNGGCNSTPFVYSAIACGASVCGTGAFNGSSRDTDWYQFNVGGPSTVTFTVTAEFPVAVGILDNNCPPAILAFVNGPACTPTSATACPSAAGTYVAFTAPQFAAIISCGCQDTYLGTLTCGPSTAPANDNCAAATAISGNGPFTGSNVCSSTDGPDPCGVLMANDVWFDWTSNVTGVATFSL